MDEELLCTCTTIVLLMKPSFNDVPVAVEVFFPSALHLRNLKTEFSLASNFRPYLTSYADGI